MFLFIYLLAGTAAVLLTAALDDDFAEIISRDTAGSIFTAWLSVALWPIAVGSWWAGVAWDALCLWAIDHLIVVIVKVAALRAG